VKGSDRFCLREQTRNEKGRERGDSKEHVYSYSTIAVGGEFLPQTDTHTSTTSTKNTNDQPEPGWRIAVRAAQAKQATDITVLDLTGITSFTDFFVICTGANIRQNQAITDEIGLNLKARGELPSSVEGYEQGEWVLSDYGDFLVHVFSSKARQYYDLERLWRDAKVIPAGDADF
jgi:ribosome-associated protein